jgi:lipoyl synthase
MSNRELPTVSVEDRSKQQTSHRRLPSWFRVPAPGNKRYTELKQLVRGEGLHTVCEEARCPNIGECWGHNGTATFMILGDVCTRSCGFCAIKTGRPPDYDVDEPRRVAEAVRTLDLRHAVITSVNRDEREDGGSEIFAETIRKVHEASPGTSVEVLIPDFKGNRTALHRVIEAHPEILNHNVETVPRLYRLVRPQARYEWSLGVLEYAKSQGMTTKTGIMVGIGERLEEVTEIMGDLGRIGCNIMTVGQYLQPTQRHLPIDRFVEPEEFVEMKRIGESLGIGHVESGPLVRSSYHAAEQAERFTQPISK